MGLLTIKSLDALQAEADRSPLRRSLGPVNLTALGIGSIIGTGIFVLTGTAASQNAGPALVLSMILSATGCAFAGLCYAEFAAMVPVAGSAYTYAYATAGELFAWIIGWDLILEYALSTATVAVGWSGYFVSLCRDLGLVIPPALTAPPGALVPIAGGHASGLFNLPASVIVLLVTALLIVGIKESATTNSVLVVIKVMVLVLFVAAGAAYVRRENLTPFIPPNTGAFGHFGWSGVLRGAGVMFFAYIGFDAVSTAAQEAKDPARDMPIGILGSLVLCTALYVGVAIVLLGIVPYQRLNVADPLAVGIDATGMRWLAPIVKTAALFGLFSTMLVTLLAQTRIFYSMSRDGLLPSLFQRVHARFRTPYLSTLLTGGIVALASGLTPIGVLSQLVSIGTLLAFVLVSLGVIILRRRAPDRPRPFRTPAVPLVPILAAVLCFAQMLGLPLETWERLVLWLAIGMVIYFGYGRRGAAAARGALGAGALVLVMAAGAEAAEPGLFAYDERADPKVVETGVEHRGAVAVRDIAFASPGFDQPVKAFLVVPPGPGPFAGVLWVHWLGPHTSDRAQLLDEAVGLASRGIASILPDALWSRPRWFGTRALERDHEASIAQVIALRRALDVLETVPGLDRARLGFVGHDYGGMYGMLLAGADARPRTYVFAACAPSLMDWAFLAKQPASKTAYLRQNADLDLTDALRGAHASVLFQFGSRDPFVSASDTQLLTAAAPGRKERRIYESDHEMDAPEVATDRDAWLLRELSAP